MNAAQSLADQAVVFQDFPGETLTIEGTEYTALVLSWRQGNHPEWGGSEGDIIGRVAIERSGVASTPTQGQTGTFRGVSVRVGQVDSSDEGASIILELEDAK